MPSITGGDSTGRDYAPHMWILGPEGDPNNENHWVFVGNTGNQSVSHEGIRYHIGANVFGELVCDSATDSYINHRFFGSFAIDEIPRSVLREALERSLDMNIIFMDRQRLVRALAFIVSGETVEFPEPVSPADMFSGDTDAQDNAQRMIEAARAHLEVLRSQLGFRD